MSNVYINDFCSRPRRARPELRPHKHQNGPASGAARRADRRAKKDFSRSPMGNPDPEESSPEAGLSAFCGPEVGPESL
ncbi:hypothetical protein T484DRAFT_1918731 [Baffinella frigidus]|nr:hypothetical protein T484DRAFT_1918731 [Cryptophyta sp. CCMP2293]